MISKILSATLFLALVCVSGAFAECDVCKVANQKSDANYLNYTGARLLQGLTNVSFSWLEVCLHPVKAAKEAKKGDCPFQVAGKGLANGLGSTGYRVVEGCGEIATALWPQRVLEPVACEVCNVEEMKAQKIVS